MALVAYNQASFAGLNLRVDSSLIGENQYPILVNGRIRTGVVKPVKKPVEIGSDITTGKIQGIYGVANFLLVFVSGKAYAKDINYPTSSFVQIKDFQMSPDAETIYVAAVPESYTNYVRKSVEDNTSTDVVFSRSKVNHTPAVVVCQDGVNQPLLIFPDGTCRKSNNFSAWTVDNREYVPIGKQMLYFNGKLYVVSPDGRRIYHSVTGRPLDFVIVVDTDGNKIEGQDAEVTAWRVNYETITAIKEISSTKEEFLVCTERASYLIRPKYDTLLCGEPLFSNQYLFSTGAKNQFSVVDILGDTTLIDFGGIKSFNSILQTSTEGKNSPFSAIISKLFSDIQQDICCCISFDNYALFSVNTVYGRVLVVFDTITNTFVSIDKYSNINEGIKYFAEVVTNAGRELFFATVDNKLYQAFSGDFDFVSVYVGDFTTSTQMEEQQLLRAKLVFLNVRNSGTIFATPYSDSVPQQQLKKSVIYSNHDNKTSTFPFGFNFEDNVKVVNFHFDKCAQAWKLGLYLQWNFDAELSFVQLICETTPVLTSIEQNAQEFVHYNSNRPTDLTISPSFGPPNTIITLKGKNLINVTNVFFNDSQVSWKLTSDGNIEIVAPSEFGYYQIRLETDTGTEFVEQLFECKQT